MKRIHAAWVGSLLVVGCGSKDHTLGLGQAPAVRSPDTSAANTTEPGSGGADGAQAPDTMVSSGAGGAPVPGAMAGTGGAVPSAVDPGVVAAGGASNGNASASDGAPASGAAGAVSSGAAGGAGTPTTVTGVAPVIPQIAGDCPVWANGTITFMGLDGVQLAVGPKPQAPSAPMLVYWHGTGSTSDEYTFMAAPVVTGITQAGGVIVSFQNTTGGDQYSGTNIFGAGDLNVVDQLVACAVRDHNIDPRKIYTMGCSGGGLFSTAMAALRSQYIAAAAPNSGGWVTPVAFSSQHTPALMTVHGAQGTDVVVLDFSQTSATADAAFNARGGFAIDCNTGSGHCGGAGLAGDVWTFFLAHPYGVTPEPWSTGLPAGFSSECHKIE